MFEFSGVEAFFPTLLWVHDLNAERAAHLNARLLADLETLTAERPALPPGENWQSEQRLHQLPQFAEVAAMFTHASGEILRFLEVDHEGFEITGCWANLSPRGAAHRAHHHSNNYLSGVYYVQVPAGSGIITFHDPRFQVEQIVPRVKHMNAHNSIGHDVAVKPGRLVMFPSWFVHSVPANPSGELRVSISANVMFSDFTRRVSAPRWAGMPLGGDARDATPRPGPGGAADA